MRLGALGVVLVLVADCLGGAPAKAPDESSPTRRSREHGVPPPIEFENSTLVNTTLRYPRLQQGMHHRIDFKVLAGSRDLYVEWQSLLECPVGRSQRAQFSLANPEGTTTEHWLPHGTGDTNGWECKDTPTAPYIRSHVARLKPEPAPGMWILRTLGECMCSARFLVTNEAPATIN